MERVEQGSEGLVVTARSSAISAVCPSGGTFTSSRHSRYWRGFADLPWRDHVVTWRVQVSRFRCRRCAGRVFAERLTGIVARKERRTLRLAEAQTEIGLALGGEPGSRLARRLAMPTSGDTILRLIRRRPPPSRPPLRVIGVDDWAWRRGRRYGTIICDLERRRVLDLLPDRSAEPLRDWLKVHPSVAVISRDRSSAYAEAGRAAAPHAVQVADRWHLLANASDALRAVLDRHDPKLREAARLCVPQREAASSSTCLRRRDLLRQPRPSDDKLAFLEERWRAGERNAARLWRDLREQGFDGGYDIVRRWIGRRRRVEAAHPRGAPPPCRAPSSRRAARLLTSDPTSLSEANRRFVDTLRALAPEIGVAADLIGAFGRIIRGADPDALDAWLEEASSSALRGSPQGLRADQEAVRAAIELPWSNGQPEGQINRPKFIKRQMFGRAKFDLLRQRVLCAA